MAGIVELGMSIANLARKPDEPKTPQEMSAPATAKEKQRAAQAQTLSSLILTRRRPLGIPGSSGTASTAPASATSAIT